MPPIISRSVGQGLSRRRTRARGQSYPSGAHIANTVPREAEPPSRGFGRSFPRGTHIPPLPNRGDLGRGFPGLRRGYELGVGNKHGELTRARPGRKQLPRHLADGGGQFVGDGPDQGYGNPVQFPGGGPQMGGYRPPPGMPIRTDQQLQGQPVLPQMPGLGGPGQPINRNPGLLSQFGGPGAIAGGTRQSILPPQIQQYLQSLNLPPSQLQLLTALLGMQA